MQGKSAFIVLTFFVSIGFAQQLQFDVATIKPADPNEPRVGMRYMPSGGAEMQGVTLKMLVAQAYNVRDFQVLGLPAWASSDRYSINAKSADTVEPAIDLRKATDQQRLTVAEQMRQRLQALLADRFQLKLHKETKEGPVYALAVAKNGPKMKEGDPTSDAPRGAMRFTPGSLSGRQVGIQQLADLLSQRLGRPVLDETGLQGAYDFDLTFTPDQSQPVGFGGPGPGPAAAPPPPPPGGAFPGFKDPPPIDPNGPTLFTAIQDQLGLKLESKKGPVENLVIDHAEKPSEN